MAWKPNRETHVSTTTRQRILRRDGAQCAACGTLSPPFEIDHIDNRRTSLYHQDENLQVLCVPCHRLKTQQEAQRGFRRKYPRRVDPHPGRIGKKCGRGVGGDPA